MLYILCHTSTHVFISIQLSKRFQLSEHFLNEKVHRGSDNQGFTVHKIIAQYHNARLFTELNFHAFRNFGDVHENKIINFPQLQCLVGTSRSNLVNFIKIVLMAIL